MSPIILLQVHPGGTERRVSSKSREEVLGGHLQGHAEIVEEEQEHVMPQSPQCQPSEQVLVQGSFS